MNIGGAGAALASHDHSTTGPHHGVATTATPPNLHSGAVTSPVVAITHSADGQGVLEAGSDGAVYAFGDATNVGSMSGTPLSRPVVGMASTPSGNGYWMAASDGGIFNFGNAAFYGSTGAMRLNNPVVGIAATPDGGGYWLVASDGGIFAFGDAGFFGSTGAMRLNRPVVGMTSSPTGNGYRLVASDGGLFSFGDAAFYGSGGNLTFSSPIVGMSTTPDGAGYWMVAAHGGVLHYGDAWPQGVNSGQASSTAAPPPAVSSVSSSPAASGNPASYTFENTNADGTPVRYNACAPIHYVLNSSEAPPGALAMVQQAISALSGATGINFVYDGASSEFPSLERNWGTLANPAPVLIAWEHQGQTDFLNAPGDAGEGGSAYAPNSAGQNVYLSGAVALDAGTSLAPGRTYPSNWEPLLLHELGHVMGLGHTQDPYQIMHPSFTANSPDHYNAGDLTGLRLLGASQGCVSTN